MEIVVLRHNLAVLGRPVDRARFDDADRAVLAALANVLPRTRCSAFAVQPATVLAWHRRLVAWRGPDPHRHRGRTPSTAAIAELVERMAEENPTWGYRRIHGELMGLGHRVAPSTVWSILRRAGLDPPPRRSGPTWSEFLAAQAKAMMAYGFLTVDTVFFGRLYVLVFIEHATRRVHLSGITARPTGPWVVQRAREVSERFSGFRFLIRDRDSKVTDRFDAVFAAAGMQVITTPARAPRANAICERVVGTLRRECLDRMLVLGARQLEAILTDYLVHYNGHRPHRSLSQRPPAGTPGRPLTRAHRGVVRCDVLGGLIHEYEWAA